MPPGGPNGQMGRPVGGARYAAASLLWAVPDSISDQATQQ